MSLSIGYPNNECWAEWFCLDEECDGASVPFATWMQEYPVSREVREHFATVGLPYNELLEARLKASDYTRVGGHIWGGGFWGQAEGKKFWTGYDGQSMEYWKQPTATDTAHSQEEKR